MTAQTRNEGEHPAFAKPRVSRRSGNDEEPWADALMAQTRQCRNAHIPAVQKPPRSKQRNTGAASIFGWVQIVPVCCPGKVQGPQIQQLLLPQTLMLLVMHIPAIRLPPIELMHSGGLHSSQLKPLEKQRY